MLFVKTGDVLFGNPVIKNFYLVHCPCMNLYIVSSYTTRTLLSVNENGVASDLFKDSRFSSLFLS